MKSCSTCGIAKPLTEFERAATNKDGLRGQCRACCSARRKAYYERNRPALLASKAQYREANRDQIAAYREQTRDERIAYAKTYNGGYYQRNKEKIKARVNENYAKNGEHVREYVRQYRRDNPDKANETSRRKRDRKRATQQLHGHHTDQQWQLLLCQYGNCCAACGTTADLTRDHIVPLSKGGTDLIDNIQPLCRSCNTRKMTKTIIYPLVPEGRWL